MRPGFSKVLVTLVLGLSSLAFLLPPTEVAESSNPVLGSALGDVPLSSWSPSLPESKSDPEVLALQGELRGILASTGNRTGSWGVLAVSLDRGDTVLALNHDTPLIPASNQKLLTTAAALYILGPDFRYTTYLLSKARIVGDVLEGDLVLYGTGDPTLSDRYYPGETAALDSLARRVLDAGILRIDGDLVVDGSYFQGPDLHPEWDPADLNDAFAAPVPSVSFNENLVTVRVKARGSPGPPPEIYTMPEGSGLRVVNTAVTRPPGTRSRIWLFRETPWDPIGIEGEIPVGGGEVWRRLPVPDPLVFTGRELKKALLDRGITVVGNIKVNRTPRASILSSEAGIWFSGPESPKILGTLDSPPLLEILRVVNKESHNLFAETVGKTLGKIVTSEGSFHGTESAVGRFLVSVVGIPRGEFRVRDGSGLSPENRISAGGLVRVLDFMASNPLWDEFLSTLPEAGVRRELGRMGGTPASRNLRAKTGTMEGVSALSGIVRTRSGERILFSILSNEIASGTRAKRAEDQVGIRLASLTRPLPAVSPQS